MPRYVQRQFRFKALALMSLQLLLVAGIMLLLDGWELSRSQASVVFLSVLSLLIIMLMLLGSLRSLYPLNYVFLAGVTGLAGVAWGVGGKFLPDAMHFQVVAIISIAMVVATGMTELLSALRWQPRQLVLASVAIGAVAGVAADTLFAPMLGSVQQHVVVSASVALGLLLTFLWEAGWLLVQCNPDTFMSVIVAMDASLLAVVALPFFWVMAIGFLVPCCTNGMYAETGEVARPAESDPPLAVIA